MSFLVPKIDSKNAKEAWRAYRMVTRGAEEAVGILRRGDVLPEVKEQIFAWELKYKPQIVGLILQDPSHPCFQKAKQLSDEEKAAEEARKARARQPAFNRIVWYEQTGDYDKLTAEANAFRRTYEMTDGEKHAIANVLYRVTRSQMKLERDENYRDGKIVDRLSDYLCAPFILEHLTELPTGWSDRLLRMIRETIDGAGLSDSEKRAAYLHYGFFDGVLVTACEAGKHDFAFVGEESEENDEDYYHPLHYKVYRCRVCGQETRTAV